MHLTTIARRFVAIAALSLLSACGGGSDDGVSDGGSDGSNPPNNDITSSQITGVMVSGVTAFGVTITWTTDESTTSQVQYGTMPSYGQDTPEDTALSTAHSVQLSGLSPNTQYHFRAHSRDAAERRRRAPA
ncbi:MAG: fibronectin type III domain-containing protein [Gammaproteobacteria bacterium]|nr:fibronectin type III domain-containing protein [Gammaproteobacteria bacterium]